MTLEPSDIDPRRLPGAGARRSLPAAFSAALAAALAALTGLAGCSRSGGETAAGAQATLEIVSCSLGCASSNTGISCGPLNIHVNEEIAIEFNDAIDISTVDKNTFQMVEIATGAVPAAAFFVDPDNPRRLVYRPALTFDSQGNPVFGLNANSSYRLTVPGSDTDTGPSQSFIRSTTGRTNARRLECTLSATEGVNDLRQGKPRVDVFFDVAKDGTVESEVLANPDEDTVLTDVFRDTQIKLVFDDVMNPATVVNPVTNAATLIQVAIDPDGNADDASDQIELTGEYNISIDQEAIQTTVTFAPDQGLPSGKSGAETRLLVVNLPEGIVDLGGNGLENGGHVAGIPEIVVFAPTVLPDGDGEDFATTDNRDRKRTGANWGPTKPGGLLGALFPGSGGGSGRLGDLEVFPAEEPTVFDTDSQTFGGPNLITTYDVNTGEPDPIEVTDGIFEFSTVTVHPGAVLRFEGEHAARVFSRGEMIVQGIVDVSGESPGVYPSLPCDVEITDTESPFYCAHLAESDDEAVQKAFLDAQGLLPGYFAGQAGGRAGAGGGDGGQGGDLHGFDASLPSSLLESKGLNNLNDTIDLDGKDGEGVPVNTLEPGITGGGGGGGSAFPSVGPVDSADTNVFNVADVGQFCNEPAGASAGGGGANSSDGAAPISRLLNTNDPNGLAPVASAGSNALLESVPADELAAKRALDPHKGFLRGGGGGGGGGASLADTHMNGVLDDCIIDDAPPLIADYRQSRGAGGGGGGGAVQLQAGKRLVVDGIVDASGGIGGGLGDVNPFGERLDNLSAGGSGAGGAILIQSEQVEIAAIPGRLQVDGGERGTGLFSFAAPSFRARGGHGGSGWVRVESGLDSDSALNKAAVAERILPTQEDLDASPGNIDDYPNAPTLDELLSLDLWRPLDASDAPGLPGPQPELRSGAQSCWLKPDGNVFFMRLFEDEPGGELGWDMDVFISIFPVSVATRSWRAEDPLLAGLVEEGPATWENLLGNQLGTSPVVVRFQGVRATRPVLDPCDAPLSGEESPFLPGSLTPWVAHPSELNDVNGAEELRPNRIRFQVVFDDNALGAGLVGGITHLSVRAQGE